MRENKLFFLLLLVVLVIVSACSREGIETWGEKKTEYSVESPSTDDLHPDDPKTPYIKYGEEIFTETATVLPENAQNELSCTSCHADGNVSNTISLVGVTNNYPSWRPRENTIFTIEDRINGCFKRSMNGEVLEFESE